ncbi:MAG: DUF1543 domain-containing protein [Mucilaginibacter sp.]
MTNNEPTPKLFMILLGSRAPGRHVEQHDFFFGIAASLKSLIQAINDFWPEAKGRIHIDAWREVKVVDGYRVMVVPTDIAVPDAVNKKLFFINLGGYQKHRFEEQHYTILTVAGNRAEAFKKARETLFFKQNHFKNATSHIDDRYGIDVDELYLIKDILPSTQKEQFKLALVPADDLEEDKINLGFLKLSLLK